MVLANNRRSGKSRGSASKEHECLFQIFYQSIQYCKDTTLKNLECEFHGATNEIQTSTKSLGFE